MEVSYIQQAILHVGLALWHPIAARLWEVPEAIRASPPVTAQLPVQDTTKKAPPRLSPATRTSELHAPPGLFAKPPIGSPRELFDGVNLQSALFKQLDFESVDSLSRLHPELKTYLFRELVIQAALRDERLEFSLGNNVWGGPSDFELSSELEGTLRRNQQMFGTTHNPLRPPPAPNQVNLKELRRAVENLIRALGVM